MCIVLALNSRPVRRLEKTWLALSNKDLLTLQNIEKLMDVSGNMRNYRKALAHVRAPAVPFFGNTYSEIILMLFDHSLMWNHLNASYVIR